MKLSNAQESIFQAIDDDAAISMWHDWKWQNRNCIHDIDTFEELLDIKFSEEKRKQYEETINRFPLSITPYYLSLINTDDLENDPVFKQAFPSPVN